MEVADHAAVSIAIDQIAADRDGAPPQGPRQRRAAPHRPRARRAPRRYRLAAPRHARLAVGSLVAAYGEATARSIAEAHLVEPPLDLTVKSDPAGWAERLGGIVLPPARCAWPIRLRSRRCPASPTANGGCRMPPPRCRPACSAMSPASASPIFAPRPAARRPQLAQAGARVTAVDISADRLKRLTANLDRLHLNAETVAADILDWSPAEPFDAVLLDAPCTATGTIRRHPDIAWLKRPADIAALAALQARMIDRAVALLSPAARSSTAPARSSPRRARPRSRRALDTACRVRCPIAARTRSPACDAAVTPNGHVRTLPFHLAGAARAARPRRLLHRASPQGLKRMFRLPVESEWGDSPAAAIRAAIRRGSRGRMTAMAIGSASGQGRQMRFAAGALIRTIAHRFHASILYRWRYAGAHARAAAASRRSTCAPPTRPSRSTSMPAAGCSSATASTSTASRSSTPSRPTRTGRASCMPSAGSAICAPPT